MMKPGNAAWIQTEELPAAGFAQNFNRLPDLSPAGVFFIRKYHKSLLFNNLWPECLALQMALQTFCATIGPTWPMHFASA
ncbi:MAG: hypothetical protein ACKO85_15075 [Isosphaeraceae bacterium]